MPAGAAIGAAAAAPSLLPIQQAAPVEPADGEAAARHPHGLGHGLPLVVDKTERGDGQHMLEAGVGERQGARVPLHPVHGPGTAGAGVVQPRGIGIEPGRGETIGRGAAGEPAGAAADVEQAVAGLRREQPHRQRVFRVADPASARRGVPGVVVGGIQDHAAAGRHKRRSMPTTAISAATSSGATARFSVIQPKRS